MKELRELTVNEVARAIEAYLKLKERQCAVIKTIYTKDGKHEVGTGGEMTVAVEIKDC